MICGYLTTSLADDRGHLNLNCRIPAEQDQQKPTNCVLSNPAIICQQAYVNCDGIIDTAVMQD